MKPEAASPAYQPLYRQIKLLITEGLESGQWKPGQSIPSELELAKRFSVSQGTVRKAVAELAQENVLVRRQGRGTFVPSHAHERAQAAFLRITPDSEPIDSIQAELVDCCRVKADERSARQLDLDPGASLIRVRRLLSINGRRVICEEVRVPAGLFKGLDAAVLESHRCMLYSVYESVFEIRIVAAEERLKALLAGPEIGDFLGLPADAPVLAMERVAYTYGRRPVELRRGFCNSADHHYANIIS